MNRRHSKKGGKLKRLSVGVAKAKKTFPDQLGPFGVVRTTYGAPHITTWQEFGMYQMEENALHSQNLRHLLAAGIDFPIVAQLSPSHPITLDPLSKKAAGIPKKATSFVWSYPSTADFEAVRQKTRDLDFTDPDVVFLSVGGYIYFTSKGDICGVNTLSPADSGGLQFDAPQHFHHEFIPHLAKAGRFQQITIKSLNDLGAQHFCWIRPNEVLTSTSGEKQSFCPNGGFVYLFHKNVYSGSSEEMEKNRYFSVFSGDDYVANDLEMKVATGDQAGTPLKGDSFELVRRKVDQLHSLIHESEQKQAHNSKVSSWTIKDVGLWLDSVELHGYKKQFSDRMIDGETLLDLDDENIKDLVDSFHVKKVMRQIKKLQLQGHNNQMNEIEVLKSQIEDLQTCAVCCATEKNSVLKPCGHICCCMDCAEKLELCPLCRRKIDSFLGVFLG